MYLIYLDNAATTKMSPEVLYSMLPYMVQYYGNPGSLHAAGRQAAEAVGLAREQVARFLGKKPEQIIFTSGGSDGNNLIIKGIGVELLRRGKTHIAVSKIEHDSLIKAAIKLSMKDEFDLSFIAPESNGAVTPGSISKSIIDRTGLVSVMTVNNETGVENDVVSIGNVCRRNGVLFHTDAVQAAGEIKLSNIPCDFMTISSHKIHGPKGVGAVFINDPKIIEPLICGGDEQEFGLRGGTENVAGIVGFGTACEIASNTIERRNEWLSSLNNHMIKELIGNLPDEFVNMFYVNGMNSKRTPKVLSLRFDGIDAQSLLLMLDSNRICVSAGSACRAHESRPSRVLTAMGLSSEQAHSTIRISFSEYNTMEEIEIAAKEIADCVRILRNMQ